MGKGRKKNYAMKKKDGTIWFWSHYEALLGLPLWPHKHDISVSVMSQLQQEGQ